MRSAAEAPPRPLRGRCARVVRYETEMISIGMDYDPGHETIEMLMGKTLDKVTGRLRHPDRERWLHIAARLIPGEMTGPNDHALAAKGCRGLRPAKWEALFAATNAGYSS